MANIIEIDRINNVIIMGTTGTTTRFPFLTATRMTYLNGERDITSISDLTAWVGGTTNQITSTSDGDGTITLSTPQNIHTGASPQFTGIELGHATDTTITRVSAGVIAVEGTNVMLVGDTPTAHTIASHSDTTGTGAELNTLTDGSDVGALHSHAAAYQPLDAELTSLAALSYVSASFVKMTGANTFALRTIGETADDLEGTIDHDLTANYDANKHIDHTGVTLTAGTGLTGGGDISANRTFAVDGLLEDLDTLGANGADSEFLVGTGAGALAWENAATARTSIGLSTTDTATFGKLVLNAASPDVLSVTATGDANPVATITGGSNTVLALISSGTVAYLKLTNSTEADNFIGSDGTSLKFWTENTARASLNSTALTLTGNIVMPDGGTIGQAAGPLLTFDDTNNYLEITGCKVGIGTTTPTGLLHLSSTDSVTIKMSADTNGTPKNWHFGVHEDTGEFSITETDVSVWLSISLTSGNVGIGPNDAVSKLSVEGTLTLKEQASADGDTAAYGQLWVKTAAPNELWFTDDAGGDHQIAYA